MINCNLNILMAKKRLNMNQVAEVTKLSQPTVSKLYNNDPEAVKTAKLSTIDKLCKALSCQPGDLLEYVPDQMKIE